MPFADQPGFVAGPFQQFWPDRKFCVQSQVGFVTRIDPIGNSQFAAISAGHQTGPRWAANGSDGKRIDQVSPLLEQLIQMRGFGVRMP